MSQEHYRQQAELTVTAVSFHGALSVPSDGLPVKKSSFATASQASSLRSVYGFDETPREACLSAVLDVLEGVFDSFINIGAGEKIAALMAQPSSAGMPGKARGGTQPAAPGSLPERPVKSSHGHYESGISPDGMSWLTGTLDKLFGTYQCLRGAEEAHPLFTICSASDEQHSIDRPGFHGGENSREPVEANLARINNGITAIQRLALQVSNEQKLLVERFFDDVSTTRKLRQDGGSQVDLLDLVMKRLTDATSSQGSPAAGEVTKKPMGAALQPEEKPEGAIKTEGTGRPQGGEKPSQASGGTISGLAEAKKFFGQFNGPENEILEKVENGTLLQASGRKEGTLFEGLPAGVSEKGENTLLRNSSGSRDDSKGSSVIERILGGAEEGKENPFLTGQSGKNNDRDEKSFLDALLGRTDDKEGNGRLLQRRSERPVDERSFNNTSSMENTESRLASRTEKISSDVDNTIKSISVDVEEKVNSLSSQIQERASAALTGAGESCRVMESVEKAVLPAGQAQVEKIDMELRSGYDTLESGISAQIEGVQSSSVKKLDKVFAEMDSIQTAAASGMERGDELSKMRGLSGSRRGQSLGAPSIISSAPAGSSVKDKPVSQIQEEKSKVLENGETKRRNWDNLNSEMRSLYEKFSTQIKSTAEQIKSDARQKIGSVTDGFRKVCEGAPETRPAEKGPSSQVPGSGAQEPGTEMQMKPGTVNVKVPPQEAVPSKPGALVPEGIVQDKLSSLKKEASIPKELSERPEKAWSTLQKLMALNETLAGRSNNEAHHRAEVHPKNEGVRTKQPSQETAGGRGLQASHSASVAKPEVRTGNIPEIPSPDQRKTNIAGIHRESVPAEKSGVRLTEGTGTSIKERSQEPPEKAHVFTEVQAPKAEKIQAPKAEAIQAPPPVTHAFVPREAAPLKAKDDGPSLKDSPSKPASPVQETPPDAPSVPQAMPVPVKHWEKAPLLIEPSYLFASPKIWEPQVSPITPVAKNHEIKEIVREGSVHETARAPLMEEIQGSLTASSRSQVAKSDSIPLQKGYIEEKSAILSITYRDGFTRGTPLQEKSHVTKRKAHDPKEERGTQKSLNGSIEKISAIRNTEKTYTMPGAILSTHAPLVAAEMNRNFIVIPEKAEVKKGGSTSLVRIVDEVVPGERKLKDEGEYRQFSGEHRGRFSRSPLLKGARVIRSTGEAGSDPTSAGDKVHFESARQEERLKNERYLENAQKVGESRKAPSMQEAAAARNAATSIESVIKKSQRENWTGNEMAAKLIYMLMKASSTFTFEHSSRVIELSAALARALGITDEDDLRTVEDGARFHDIGEVELDLQGAPQHVKERLSRYLGVMDLRNCSFLHDIGKVKIPESILYKPGRLTDEEFEVLKQHPVIGEAILKPLPSMAHVLPVVRHHHEKYDGSGYPDRLSGGDIPLAARIVGITDAFDAMVSDRPYRKGMSLEDAVKELKRCAGTHFDPILVEKFIHIVSTEAF
ncbi:MAG: HD domain-containing phosphohydrolase [Candidatus Eremiobacteraeota bacterium]|nr:HD domain-containing phosphohydrolase [Candidatus Eremiobacteraeota bacterium]